MNDSTTALLNERQKTHGDFAVHAYVTQELKRVMAEGLGEQAVPLTPVQHEAIDMICHKLGRIAAGDPNFKDHWDDIAGYARLVAERL